MALFVRQDEERTEVQKRVASELQERLRTGAKGPDLNDHEPDILKGQHETRHAGMAIIILIAVLVVVAVWFAVSISQ